MKFYIRIGLAGPNVFHLPAKGAEGASSKGADVDSIPAPLSTIVRLILLSPPYRT